MPSIKSYPLPIKFDTLCMLTGRRTGSLSFNTWWTKFNDYGPGHSYVHHREELETKYHADPLALNGLWHMVMNADPAKPFTKLQQTLLISAFPNSAKKLILSMKCAGEIIEWASTKPDELLAAMEVIIPKAPASVREYRAGQQLKSLDEVKRWVVDGVLPSEYQKIRDAEMKRRAELAAGGSTVAPETKPVPQPVVVPDVLRAEMEASMAALRSPTMFDGTYTILATTGALGGGLTAIPVTTNAHGTSGITVAAS